MLLAQDSVALLHPIISPEVSDPEAASPVSPIKMRATLEDFEVEDV